MFAKNNVLTETDSFIVFYTVVNFAADLLNQVVVASNAISNIGGKGLVAFDGSSGLIFRSTALPVHALGNILGSLTFQAGWAAAPGSTGSIVGFNTAVFVPLSCSVIQDTIIPAFP
jgi:hypothetical protein